MGDELSQDAGRCVSVGELLGESIEQVDISTGEQQWRQTVAVPPVHAYRPRPTTLQFTHNPHHQLLPDMVLGHWVTGSMGHLDHLSRLGHRVIILTRCETRVFPVFEKKPKIKI